MECLSRGRDHIVPSQAKMRSVSAVIVCLSCILLVIYQVNSISQWNNRKTGKLHQRSSTLTKSRITQSILQYRGGKTKKQYLFSVKYWKDKISSIFKKLFQSKQATNSKTKDKAKDKKDSNNSSNTSDKKKSDKFKTDVSKNDNSGEKSVSDKSLKKATEAKASNTKIAGTSSSLTRIQKELQEFMARPPALCKVSVGSNIRQWVVSVTWPEGTIYAGETYQLQFKFTKDYPSKPPIVYFLKPIPKHVHVYTNGDICLNLIGKDWRPSMTAESIVISIQSMLSSAKEKKLPPDNAMYSENPPGQQHGGWMYHDDKC